MTEQTAQRDVLPATRMDAAAHAQSAAFHKDFVDQVKDAIAKNRVVVVGMGWNPHVGKAHAALKAAGVAFARVDHGNYLTGWRRRLAVKMWTGFPTFPQVFVDGVLIGGRRDLVAWLKDGRLKASP